jgi:hypothetical protein
MNRSQEIRIEILRTALRLSSNLGEALALVLATAVDMSREINVSAEELHECLDAVLENNPEKVPAP